MFSLCLRTRFSSFWRAFIGNISRCLCHLWIFWSSSFSTPFLSIQDISHEKYTQMSSLGLVVYILELKNLLPYSMISLILVGSNLSFWDILVWRYGIHSYVLCASTVLVLHAFETNLIRSKCRHANKYSLLNVFRTKADSCELTKHTRAATHWWYNAVKSCNCKIRGPRRQMRKLPWRARMSIAACTSTRVHKNSQTKTLSW